MKQLLGETPDPIHYDRLKVFFRAHQTSKSTLDADTETRTQEGPKRRHPRTMTQSFYAVMGGFALDSSTAEPNFLPDSRTRLTLTLNGLVFIANKAPALLPDISRESISAYKPCGSVFIVLPGLLKAKQSDFWSSIPLVTPFVHYSSTLYGGINHWMLESQFSCRARRRGRCALLCA
jgi:hypothetical protein